MKKLWYVFAIVGMTTLFSWLYKFKIFPQGLGGGGCSNYGDHTLCVGAYSPNSYVSRDNLIATILIWFVASVVVVAIANLIIKKICSKKSVEIHDV